MYLGSIRMQNQHCFLWYNIVTQANAACCSFQNQPKQLVTKMHSSRMRTGHSLTVCWRLLLGEGGGCLLLGGVCSRGICSGGSAPGWVCSRGVWSGGGCLVRGSAPGGVCSRGGLLPGGSVPGGCLLQGVVSQHALRQTPPLWTESQTPVKTLSWPNFVAAGNNHGSLYAIRFNLIWLIAPMFLNEIYHPSHQRPFYYLMVLLFVFGSRGKSNYQIHKLVVTKQIN